MLLSQTNNGTTHYLLPDAQNSTRALTDVSGNITSNYDYDAFGNLLGEPTLETNYLYTGQQYDVISELYSLRARYYDASIGRFLSRDTWAYDYQNPVELNRYVYTANNPATWSDPSGNMLSIASFIPSAQNSRSTATIGISTAFLYKTINIALIAAIAMVLGRTWNPDYAPDKEGVPELSDPDRDEMQRNLPPIPDPDPWWKPWLNNIKKLWPFALPWPWVPHTPDRTKPEDDDANNVSVYRVQSRTPDGTKRSQERIRIDALGNVTITKKQQFLYIWLRSFTAAMAYLRSARNFPGSYILTFEIPEEFAIAIETTAIPQEGASRICPSCPQYADHEKYGPFGYGLPFGWNVGLELAAIPGTGKTVYQQ